MMDFGGVARRENSNDESVAAELLLAVEAYSPAGDGAAPAHPSSSAPAFRSEYSCTPWARPQADFDGTLSAISKIGYKTVELAVFLNAVQPIGVDPWIAQT